MSSTSNKRKAPSSSSKKVRLFTRKEYIKPPFGSRVIGRASVIWTELKDLDLSKRPVNKWTIKQKEEFIKSMNKYTCVTTVDDPGTERGDLYEVMAKVNRYISEEDDEEMQHWLDPDYIFIDWSGSAVSLPYPNLATLVPPLSNTIQLLNTTHSQCYMVPSEKDGEFLLGVITTRWPGTVGVHSHSNIPLTMRP